jgi:hypothetical protein
MKWALSLNRDHSQQWLNVAGCNSPAGFVVVAEFDAADLHVAMEIADQVSPTYRDDSGALRFRDPRSVN